MESTYDFWRMLLQYKVRSVVMLTSYQEGSKDKCYEYFPCDSPQNLKFHEITIRCKKVFDFPTHKKRILTIERVNQLLLSYRLYLTAEFVYCRTTPATLSTTITSCCGPITVVPVTPTI